MAEKKTPEKKPEKKKPEPVKCDCGKAAVVTKVKGGAYIVGCPNWVTCNNGTTSGRWPTKAEAVDEWNSLIAERKAKKKEAKKK